MKLSGPGILFAFSFLNLGCNSSESPSSKSTADPVSLPGPRTGLKTVETIPLKLVERSVTTENSEQNRLRDHGLKCVPFSIKVPDSFVPEGHIGVWRSPDGDFFSFQVQIPIDKSQLDSREKELERGISLQAREAQYAFRGPKYWGIGRPLIYKNSVTFMIDATDGHGRKVQGYIQAKLKKQEEIDRMITILNTSLQTIEIQGD